MTKQNQTVKSMADALGIGERQLFKDFENGCPRDSVKSALQWRIDHKIRSNAILPNGSHPSGGSMADLKEEMLRATLGVELGKLDKMTFENQQLREKFIESDVVAADLLEFGERLEERLSRLADEICDFIPAELQKSVRKKVEVGVRLAVRGFKNNTFMEKSENDQNTTTPH
ncbi:MAG TPA: hypothetical protein DD473_04625 [Planctomycetaceae bacterium]|nr:hypothetical protein [Planctomycetaceae bacterium]|tara:strand:+ start:149 stop:664 length:516 start_codon:yes stop_codon:yes gene_type:complete